MKPQTSFTSYSTEEFLAVSPDLATNRRDGEGTACARARASVDWLATLEIFGTQLMPETSLQPESVEQPDLILHLQLRLSDCSCASDFQCHFVAAAELLSNLCAISRHVIGSLDPHPRERAQMMMTFCHPSPVRFIKQAVLGNLCDFELPQFVIRRLLKLEAQLPGSRPLLDVNREILWILHNFHFDRRLSQFLLHVLNGHFVIDLKNADSSCDLSIFMDEVPFLKQALLANLFDNKSLGAIGQRGNGRSSLCVSVALDVLFEEVSLGI
mmetsp:Transcript_56528/g.101325  ORF Transcript_56528/g.101325 Transcript_56528/m.101325 type:complete len:269 (+) Transcript_56528:100-906(+)